eukprot:NODE_3600_length_2012_cov_13.429178.p1 GENE.NODE_3600_length_2012_cov_13.429178~~NODE_3600_length_2012_cov_13.429178.p1  ORF type:complete len:567 (-),score=124.88 NODE_3600_length_2012_cov_13.429178:220-1920(-)
MARTLPGVASSEPRPWPTPGLPQSASEEALQRDATARGAATTAPSSPGVMPSPSDGVLFSLHRDDSSGCDEDEDEDEDVRARSGGGGGGRRGEWDIESLFEFNVDQLVRVARAAAWGYPLAMAGGHKLGEWSSGGAGGGNRCSGGRITPVHEPRLRRPRAAKGTSRVKEDGFGTSADLRETLSELQGEVKHLRRELSLKSTQVERLRRVVCELLCKGTLEWGAAATRVWDRMLCRSPQTRTQLRASARELVRHARCADSVPKEAPKSGPECAPPRSPPATGRRAMSAERAHVEPESLRAVALPPGAAFATSSGRANSGIGVAAGRRNSWCQSGSSSSSMRPSPEASATAPTHPQQPRLAPPSAPATPLSRAQRRTPPAPPGRKLAPQRPFEASQGQQREPPPPRANVQRRTASKSVGPTPRPTVCSLGMGAGASCGSLRVGSDGKAIAPALTPPRAAGPQQLTVAHAMHAAHTTAAGPYPLRENDVWSPVSRTRGVAERSGGRDVSAWRRSGSPHGSSCSSIRECGHVAGQPNHEFMSRCAARCRRHACHAGTRIVCAAAYAAPPR